MAVWGYSHIVCFKHSIILDHHDNQAGGNPGAIKMYVNDLSHTYPGAESFQQSVSEEIHRNIQ